VARVAPLILLIVLAAGCSGTAQGPVHRAAPGALGPYSGSVESAGFVFVSGKIGRRGGTFVDEANTAIDAVAEELGRANLTLADAVSVTVYLTDLDRYGEFNEIYAGRFPAPYPARVCVEVSRLPGDARVEIAVLARRR
jgi:2-iminobutanoate/2-iminopropanoate deaminase